MHHQHVVAKPKWLAPVHSESEGFTTTLVTLLRDKYVANAGNCRAVLAR